MVGVGKVVGAGASLSSRGAPYRRVERAMIRILHRIQQFYPREKRLEPLSGDVERVDEPLRIKNVEGDLFEPKTAAVHVTETKREMKN